MNHPHIIVITGAESTGKSVLTKQLGAYFSSPCYPEYARTYLENKGHSYTEEDVEKIARVQQAQLRESLILDSRFVFFDTWLIITKVWMEVVYGRAPEWIDEEIAGAPVALYLLCDTSIPWESDPLRENGGEMREKLSAIYEKNLIHYRFRYSIVTGTGKERFENAVEIIRKNFAFL